MKKNLRKLLAGAILFLFAAFTQQASASHFQGSDLTYIAVSPGVYSVNLKIYRDCSGTVAPTTATLNLKSVGCNAGRNVTMTKVGANRVGNAYCAGIVPGCTLNGLTNYEEVNFTATISFTAAEQTCPEWLLSWVEIGGWRPTTANLIGTDNFYTEAMINLTAGINNNSPQFGSLNIPIPFVNYNQPIQISANAIEADGDSLVYSLVDPLSNFNSPIYYKAFPNTTIYNSDSTKNAQVPAGMYSSAFPLFSYYTDWSNPIGAYPIPKFMFDSRTGSIGFIPCQYDAVSPSSNGMNKYVVVVKIDEYRKIGGVITKVGTIKRDMLINIIDCGPNQNPRISAPVVNGQQIDETDVINLRPGTPMHMQFATTDGNPTDILAIESDIAQVLPGATLTTSTGNYPTVNVNWTPTANMVRGQIYYFHVTVQDNACPVKGYQTHTFGVRVSATGGVTGVEELAAKPRFVAYPNPFSETVSFKLNITKGTDQQLVIYNVLGQKVDIIDLSNLGTGEQTITWKAAAKVAKGQYVAKLISNQKEVQTIQFSKLQ